MDATFIISFRAVWGGLLFGERFLKYANVPTLGETDREYWEMQSVGFSLLQLSSCYS